MLEIAVACPHCGTTNTITVVGCEEWEWIDCRSCHKPMGNLEKLKKTAKEKEPESRPEI